MITTIDKSGRLVIPQALRAAVGITPGEVEISVAGNGLRIDVPTSKLVRKDGRLVLPAGGRSLTPDEIRELRLADQR
jgi:hypothetical protein